MTARWAHPATIPRKTRRRRREPPLRPLRSQRDSCASHPADGSSRSKKASPPRTARIERSSRTPARPGSILTRGASTASTTSFVAPRRSGIRTSTATSSWLVVRGWWTMLIRPASVLTTNHEPPTTNHQLIREFLRKVHPFPVGCQLLVRLPVQTCLLRLAVLLERDGQIEVRLCVGGIQLQRVAVADARV